LRCPVCDAILHDSNISIEVHRRNRKGECGTNPHRRREGAPVTESERYEIDRAVRADERRLRGRPDAALQRWARR
jgi:hypothetical protein